MNNPSADVVLAPGAACFFWMLAHTAPAIWQSSFATWLVAGKTGSKKITQLAHKAACNSAFFNQFLSLVYLYKAINDSRKPKEDSELLKIVLAKIYLYHISDFEGAELVLPGNYLPHCWHFKELKQLSPREFMKQYQQDVKK